MEACERGHKEVVELLVSKGADVNARYEVGIKNLKGDKAGQQTINWGPDGYPIQFSSEPLRVFFRTFKFSSELGDFLSIVLCPIRSEVPYIGTGPILS